MWKAKGITAILTAAMLLASPLSAAAAENLHKVANGDQFSDPLSLTPERVTNGAYAAYMTRDRTGVVLVHLADQSQETIYSTADQVITTMAMDQDHVVFADLKGVYLYDLKSGQQKSIGPSGKAGHIYGIDEGRVIFAASTYQGYQLSETHVYQYDLSQQKLSDLAGYDQQQASEIGRISGDYLLTRLPGDTTSQLVVFNLEDGSAYRIDGLPSLTVAFAADRSGNVYWEETGSDYKSKIVRYNRADKTREVLFQEKSSIAGFVIDKRDRLLYQAYNSELDSWHMKLVDPTDSQTPMEYIGDTETSYQDFSLLGDTVYVWAEQDHGQSIELIKEELTPIETTLPFDGEEAHDHDHDHEKAGIVIQIGSNKAHAYHGEEAEEIEIDAPPYIEGERTMVPLRAVSNALGAEVQWDEATQRITLTKEGRTVQLFIAQKQAFVDGSMVQLETAPVKRADRTFVPVRFVSEMLGADVQWDGATQSITIETAMQE